MDIPETQEQHVVEFVFAKGSGDGDKEGLSKEWRAGVIVARLFVLFPQVHRDHYMVCVLHPVYRQLKSAQRSSFSLMLAAARASEIHLIYVLGIKPV